MLAGESQSLMDNISAAVKDNIEMCNIKKYNIKIMHQCIIENCNI